MWPICRSRDRSGDWRSAGDGRVDPRRGAPPSRSDRRPESRERNAALMPDPEAVLVDLAGHPPYRPAPLPEIAGRGRRHIRRRRARAAVAAVAICAVVASGVTALTVGQGGGRTVTVSGPTGPQGLVVNGSSWRGHGRLALITGGRLGLVDDAGRTYTVGGSGVDTSPAWSADGKWVGFVRAGSASSETNELWVAPTAATPTRSPDPARTSTSSPGTRPGAASRSRLPRSQSVPDPSGGAGSPLVSPTSIDLERRQAHRDL